MLLHLFLMTGGEASHSRGSAGIAVRIYIGTCVHMRVHECVIQMTVCTVLDAEQ